MKKIIESILHNGVVILLFISLVILSLDIIGYGSQQIDLQNPDYSETSNTKNDLGLGMLQLYLGTFIVLSLFIATIFALIKDLKLLFNVVALFTLSGISYLSIIIFNQVPGNKVIVAPIIAFSLLFLAILKTINDKKTGKLTR